MAEFLEFALEFLLDAALVLIIAGHVGVEAVGVTIQRTGRLLTHKRAPAGLHQCSGSRVGGRASCCRPRAINCRNSGATGARVRPEALTFAGSGVKTPGKRIEKALHYQPR